MARPENEGGFWTAASIGAAVPVVFLCALAGFYTRTGVGVVADILVGTLLGLGVFVTSFWLLRVVAGLARRLPSAFLLYGAAAVVTAVVLRNLRFGWPSGLYYPSVTVFIIAQAMLIGALWTLWRHARPSSSAPPLSSRTKWQLVALALVALAVDVAGIGWILHSGGDPYPIRTAGSDAEPSRAIEPLTVDNPATPGSFEVETLTYGSGGDIRRPEYGVAVDIETRRVDASKLLPEWKGFDAWVREWYWGFGLEEAPLNARVWAPVGDGPFPIALIVHGNHSMQDYSDPGYAYLGELLASRGFLFASVDENYINGNWSGDFRGREMPLRAWFLLEHLLLWKEWNETEGHRFFGRVDMDRVALLGHSRGGEAVSIAAAYNRLPHYPDDATLAFDYGFNIRSLVAIAQIDRRYHRRVELENVNFFTIHGSYDSDEASYDGVRQFRRIRFTDEDGYWFKAGVFIHGANHGQFNTGWGRRDAGPPGSWLLNLRPIIPGEQQREVAKVYISAFLEATLHEDERYLPLFRDARRGRQWLPEQIYVNQFDDSSFRALADYEEDLDVTTATLPQARVETASLSLWREEELRFRDDQRQGTNAVVLGWNRERQEGAKPSYTIQVPSDFAADPPIDETTRLVFFLGSSTENPPEEDEDGDTDAEGGEETKGDLPRAIDLSIELVDAASRKARVSLSQFASVAPPLRIQFLKLAGLNRERYGRLWEPALQSYELPLSIFTGRNTELDLTSLRSIRFEFDRSQKGVVILDDIGFRSAFD